MTSEFYAVDPGDVHVGLAYFRDGSCVWAREFDPTGALRFLREHLPGSDALVVERYQLYPHLAQLQQGSDMRTSQMIGALKYLAWRVQVPVYIQQAALKKTAESLINHRKIQRQSLGAGNHAKDAETHGYAYLWRPDRHDPEQAQERASRDLFGA